MKHASIILGLLASMSLTAQTNILTEDFNTAIPAAWAQNPAASWSHHASFGVSGSGCAITQADFAEQYTITTTSLNLTGYTNLSISFDAAIVKNNFMDPKIILWYDDGSGPQQLASWGTLSSSGTTYNNITGKTQYNPPLQPQNVSWHPCTHALGTLSGNTSAVQLIFQADMFNGGYVLLDNIVLSGTPPIATGIATHTRETEPFFANPVKGRQLVLGNAGQLKEAVLFNATGQQLLSQEQQSSHETLEMNLENLPAGLYILGLRLEDQRWLTRKVVVE